MSSQNDEVILAQEQGVTMRSAGGAKELEAEFGVGTIEGTLVLTNKRLIFVCTNEEEEDLPGAALNPLSKFRLVYSEVEDLASIPTSSPNVFVPITSVSLVAGHRGGVERPSLRLTWKDNDGDHTMVFTEGLIGRRKRNLNDWVPIITNLKAGTQKLVPLPSPPSTDSLEGQIIRVLSDMQEKGVFEIEEAVETRFKVDLDPDQVQAACDKLASQGLLVRFPDSSGDVFYRRASPLGEDNPSN
ncbi:MAG TPA: hypothetical protein VGR53_03710 [Nitrososphaerales archaeon]|nr:hypothetical protein [Nitrososphaerales archaeon]